LVYECYKRFKVEMYLREKEIPKPAWLDVVFQNKDSKTFPPLAWGDHVLLYYVFMYLPAPLAGGDHVLQYYVIMYLPAPLAGGDHVILYHVIMYLPAPLAGCDHVLLYHVIMYLPAPLAGGDHVLLYVSASEILSQIDEMTSLSKMTSK